MMLNRVSLNTIGLNRIGLNRIGKPSRGSFDRPYIDPEVLASLKAVCICYGKSNEDPDRAIVKNLVDPDNPFVISNAAFKLNSGFGKYSADFESFDWAVNISQKQHNKATISLNGRLCNHTAIEIDEMKVNIIGNVTELIYWYIANPDDTTRSEIRLTSGINTLPKSYAKDNGQTYNIGFAYISGDSEITIEQIPSFEGAFVTDGIDDLITSTKTAEEMGITNEVTVVSMIHQIALNSTYNIGTTNYLENLDNGRHIRSDVYHAGKTGIYGYTASLINNTASDIKNILGDKADYSTQKNEPSQTLHNSKFSVVGRARNLSEPSSVAWYWTIIANKVLTTDQINQVIAYFNLDRTLRPDILCNITKQGITNDNHADFNDKLIDYSGNGRDIQMYNLAWKGDSGIGKYEMDFLDFNYGQGLIIESRSYNKFIAKTDVTTNPNILLPILTKTSSKDVFWESTIIDVELEGGCYLTYFYINEEDALDRAIFDIIKSSGRYTLPKSYGTPNASVSIGFYIGGLVGTVKVTQIPSHAGALCLDGVNDFGQFVGDLGLKDYTLIMNRAYNNLINNQVPLVSSNIVEDQTPFIVEHWNTGSNAISFSYGASRTTDIPLDINKKIVYQSTYSYMGYVIPKGNAISTGGGITLGKFGNGVQYSAICLWSLMLFPYSMSEFLIERQLKKYKLGTLYPDMVEFRPVIKANNDYEIVYTAIIKPNNWQEISVGDYVTVGESVAIQIKLNNPLEVTNVSSNSLADVSFYKEETGDNVYTIYGRLLDGKSPQKISLTIEQDENYVLFNPTINSNAVLEVGNEQNMTELIAKVRNHEIDGFIMYLSKLESKYILPNSWINKDTEVISYIYCLDNILQDDLHINIDGNSKYCLYADSSNNIAEFIIMDDNIFEEQYITNVLTVNTIDIQLDQYIRYEDIVQPYPVLLRFNDENGNEVSWGGKFRVGSTITRIGSFYENNLIDGLYIVRNPKLNGNNLITPTHVVEKSMVFTCDTEYLLDNNEPKCILSPSRLRMPNSSYKILGYIPDISGHGNHGVIHNSAYAEGSGVNEDGSYQLDGVDDFVTIPTLSSGGKQVLMKVNWWGVDDGVIYDQRNGTTVGVSNQLCFSLYPDSIAYQFRNVGGKTFIDGILNNNIVTQNLKGITHNITSITNYDINNSSTPFIGANAYSNKSYVPIALYDFMLFDNISTDDKIKELNEYVGIEGNTDDLFNETN